MNACTPNAVFPARSQLVLVAGWLGFWLVTWTAWHPILLPSPLEVAAAIPRLWFEEGLADQIASSVRLNLTALGLSIAIALPLAYLSRVPFVRPLAVAVAKLRYLGPTVFFALLIFMLQTGHDVKIAMLTLGETFFLLTSLLTVVDAIPEDALDDARTMRMGEWAVLWYVVIRGTVPDVLRAIRDNAAMLWNMTMMVEGIVRAEGGVGLLMVTQERYQNFDGVYAIALVVLAVGLLQDAALGELERLACPYASSSRSVLRTAVHWMRT